MRKVRLDAMFAALLSAAILVCVFLPAERLARSSLAMTNLFAIVEADLRNPILTSPAAISMLNGATKGIAQFAGYDAFYTRVDWGDETKVANVTRFCGDLFGMLNVRWLVKGSAVESGPVLYISEAFWMEAFQGDLEILGQELRIHQITYRIAGVLSDATRMLGPTDLWIPMRSRGVLSAMSSMKIVGKLQWGVDLAGAQRLIAKTFRTFLPEQHYVDRPGACLLPMSEAMMFQTDTAALANRTDSGTWSDS
ncbi:MAG TPA: ABC transporter permease [Verrucomicrobiae bacterium]